jgi:hypothetical protein
MQRREERREERWPKPAEEVAGEEPEGRRTERPGSDRERPEVPRLASELLVDQAERHHRQRPVVGLPRRIAAARDPVQRLAEGRERLAIAPSSSQTNGNSRLGA